MRKQTDLSKVKQTALALLSTEINETPYSPMIVKHPFTDIGVSAELELIEMMRSNASIGESVVILLLSPVSVYT